MKHIAQPTLKQIENPYLDFFVSNLIGYIVHPSHWISGCDGGGHADFECCTSLDNPVFVI